MTLFPAVDSNCFACASIASLRLAAANTVTLAASATTGMPAPNVAMIIAAMHVWKRRISILQRVCNVPGNIRRYIALGKRGAGASDHRSPLRRLFEWRTSSASIARCRIQRRRQGAPVLSCRATPKRNALWPNTLPSRYFIKGSDDEKDSGYLSCTGLGNRQLEEDASRAAKGRRKQNAGRMAKMDERSRQDVRRQRRRRRKDEARHRARHVRLEKRHHVVRDRRG